MILPSEEEREDAVAWKREGVFGDSNPLPFGLRIEDDLDGEP